MDVNDLTQILTISLSIVALVITVIGFFASLKFYRDGMDLQEKANTALTRIEEKTASIDRQFGGAFDKTLEAAIGKRTAIETSFEALNAQLEATATSLIEGAQAQIGATSKEERGRIEGLVKEQMRLLQKTVTATREKAEAVAESDFPLELRVTPTRKQVNDGIKYVNALIAGRTQQQFSFRELLDRKPHWLSVGALVAAVEELIASESVERIPDAPDVTYRATNR